MSGWLRTAGLACFAGGLLFARSHSSRDVAGRWSLTFAAIIGAAFLLAAGSAAWAARARARRDEGDKTDPLVAAARAALDTSVFLWGVAYLLSAWLAPSTAGRIVELAPFGSISPIPSLLEWSAMALAVLAAALAIAPRLRRRRAEAWLAAGAVVAFLVLAEGVTRLKVAVHPTVDGFPTYSTKAWTRRFAPVDRDGFRVARREGVAPEGARRLAVVGDSVAFGWGIRRAEERFGEVLAGRVTSGAGGRWELVTLARADTNTLDHIRFLQSLADRPPEVAVLLYVFNDIDYVRAATPRTGWGTWHPAGICFRNSYLFQEIYLRFRASGLAGNARPPSPYFDAEVLGRHVEDVARWVEQARTLGARALVVPIDAGVTAEPELVRQYRTFYRAGEAAGLPLCSLEHAFDGLTLDEVTVNRFDRHPNERAHRLAAEAAARCLAPILASSGTPRP